MSDLRLEILSEIKRLAAEADGQAPGQNLFGKVTGIKNHKWRGVYWARWGDALSEAGFEPNSFQSKYDSDEMVLRLARIAVENGKFPTNSELSMLRRKDKSVPSPKLFIRHFGGRSGLLAALRKLAKENREFSQLESILPASKDEQRAKSEKLEEGWVYLLKSGEFFKIGRSDNVEKRIKQISISLPEDLTLIHAIETDDPSGIEAYWHKRFGDKRKKGEWFQLSPSDLKAFQKRKFQ